MHVWILVPILLVTQLSSSFAQDYACKRDMKSCTQAYLHDILEQPHELCRLTNVFLGCVFRSSCHLPQSAKEALIRRSENELRSKGFMCSLRPVSSSWKLPSTTPVPRRSSTSLPWVKSTTAATLASGSMNQLLSSGSSNCASKIKSCAEVYLTDVAKYPGRICEYTQTYIDCVLGKCHFSTTQRNALVSSADKTLANAGFSCKIKTGSSFGTWKNSLGGQYKYPDYKFKSYTDLHYKQDSSSGVTAQIYLPMMATLLLIFALASW